MNKEQAISSIKQRILDEQRKHPTIDWAESAARKITVRLKNRFNVFQVVLYFSAVN